MTFRTFATRIKDQFDKMSQHELFTIAVSGDEMWVAYLAAFPEGTNPIYRVRTEHDCSCCRNFIRNVGNVVAIVNGQLVSVWDADWFDLDAPYDTIAEHLASFVKSHEITGVFRAREPKYGDESTYERTEEAIKRWDHFHAKIAPRHYAGRERDAKVGELNSIQQVFKRGLDELKPDALNTVLELIDSKALYRGEEHLNAVAAFHALQITYRTLPAEKRDIFVWSNLTNPAARFRNTVIGTLVQDLSEGVDLEKAVKSFEAKVAPENYKRPTALITPRMIQDAMKTVGELGLESALERRFARLSDVSVNNVLWVDNSVRGQMKGGLEGLLMEATAPRKLNDAKAEDIGIDDFMSNVLPQTTSLDVFVKNAQQGNFMSLTAPVHAEVEQLFKWSNNFGWSYNGNVTDSIKERVKKAGGSVEGDLCCRLAWEYRDDLDFHMTEPDGSRINFSTYRRRLSPNGGMLDLDANGADGHRDDPAENIFYADRRKMREGIYTLLVNNFSRRSDGKGFEVEIEFDGQVHHIAYDRVLSRGATITVAQIEYKAGAFRIVESLPSSQTSRSVWGVATETFVKVNTLMQSPNHWDGQAVGNKHWFFVLDGCVNDQPTRGVYNEFLRGDLDKHRKVFEILGDKTKCQPTDGQLSGLGFSSTRGDTVLVNVTGPKIRKLYNIVF